MDLIFDNHNQPLPTHHWIDQVTRALFSMNYFELILYVVDSLAESFSFLNKYAPEPHALSKGRMVAGALEHTDDPITLWFKQNALY